MFNFLKGLAAVVFAVVFAYSIPAVADDHKDDKKAGDHGQAEKKMDCGYCMAVSNVAHNMRCEGCAKADKQCQHCMDMGKKLMDSASCAGCKEMMAKGGDGAKNAAACGNCTSAMKEVKADGHCKFCSEKQMVMQHAYCCDGCKKKGDKAAQGCEKCMEMRKMVGAAKCPMCDGGKKS